MAPTDLEIETIAQALDALQKPAKEKYSSVYVRVCVCACVCACVHANNKRRHRQQN